MKLNDTVGIGNHLNIIVYSGLICVNGATTVWLVVSCLGGGHFVLLQFKSC